VFSGPTCTKAILHHFANSWPLVASPVRGRVHAWASACIAWRSRFYPGGVLTLHHGRSLQFKHPMIFALCHYEILSVSVCVGVCVWVCVCVRVCVCVKHLNRCKTSNRKSRGAATHDCLSWPTKTRQHGGVNVPASSIFWSALHGPKPRTPTWRQFMLCTFAAIWYLTLSYSSLILEMLDFNLAYLHSLVEALWLSFCSRSGLSELDL